METATVVNRKSDVNTFIDSLRRRKRKPKKQSRVFNKDAQPFVKWVGGKRQLLPELLPRVPKEFDSYYEPFLGGGALYFALQPEKAVLSDINAELINTYQVVISDVEKLISDLGEHNNSKDYFLELRKLDRCPEYKKLGNIERASRFIFLNKTCFNGLYRVNSSGFFNVPFGKYENPKIVDPKRLQACSLVLATADIKAASFEHVLDTATEDDFVYFDPPYVPKNTTSNFTGYSQDGFGHQDQVALRDLCIALDERGVRFMASNAGVGLVYELYEQFNVETVAANRAVNCKGAKRGRVPEVIITNY